ncbi:lipopolysaccharide biosynthesis protein [Cryobacterium glaciale]|uniref:lipopolysaccharide biosynthesis protein n=1 Tax=Cryobacterium glaciale TaxID=1259145 RepID=UPI00141A9E7E|nr:oligosaccharide flippase family protein [Cryobacterium glaciale]
MKAVISRAGAIFASLVLSVLVARVLGPEESGKFFLLMAVLGALNTVARYGTDNAALKILGGASSRVGRDLFHLAALVVLCSLAVVGCSLGVILILRPDTGGNMAVYFVTASAIVPQALVVLFGTIMRGRQMLAVGTMAELGSIATLSVLLLTPVALLGTSSVITAMGCVALASWLTLMWSAPVAYRALSTTDKNAGDFSFIGLQKFFSIWKAPLTNITSSSLLIFLLNWFPVFLLSAVGTLTDVSYFVVAMRLVGFITLIPAIQASYLTPAIGRDYHHGAIQHLNNMCIRAARQAFALSSLPTLILVFAAHPLVTYVYGGGFSPVAAPVVVMAVAALVVSYAGPVNALMFLCDLEGVSLILNVGVAAAWASIGLWITLTYGLMGAASFQGAASILVAVISACSLRHKRNIISFVRFSRVTSTPECGAEK